MRLTKRFVKYSVPPVVRLIVTGNPARSHMASMTMNRASISRMALVGTEGIDLWCARRTYPTERQAPRYTKGR